MLVPVLGLVQVSRHAMADRYTYLPSIGLSIARGLAAGAMGSRSLDRRRALAWGAAAVTGRAGPAPCGKLRSGATTRRCGSTPWP